MNVLITGGAGTLGQAIMKYGEGHANFTVYSRDPMKHNKLRKQFPATRFVVGDINDPLSLHKAMVGHDIVIHAAANKHIPECEHFPQNAYDVNVNGSLAVLQAAVEADVERVVGISTDKVCYPVNAYGCTKKMMEHAFMEYALAGFDTEFALVRYGNVLASNGSVIQVWSEMIERDGYITATRPDMTRFWLSQTKAAQLVWATALFADNATCIVPMLPAMDMAALANAVFPGAQVNYIGLRPGEKYHETMITKEESSFCGEIMSSDEFPFPFVELGPTTEAPYEEGLADAYSSDDPIENMGYNDILSMLQEDA